MKPTADLKEQQGILLLIILLEKRFIYGILFKRIPGWKRTLFCLPISFLYLSQLNNLMFYVEVALREKAAIQHVKMNSIRMKILY